MFVEKNNFIALLKASWISHKNCLKVLWWPLSFLVLLPLVIAIICVLLPVLWLISHEIMIDSFIKSNIFHIIFSALLMLGAIPFIEGCNIVIRDYLNNKEIDENTGFKNIKSSFKKTGIPCAIVVLLLSFTKIYLSKWLVFYYVTTLMFTDVIAADYRQERTYNAWIKSFVFTNYNLIYIFGLLLIRFTILVVIFLPLILIKLFSFSIGLIVLSVAVFIGLFIKLYPYYYFLPNYFYYALK